MKPDILATPKLIPCRFRSRGTKGSEHADCSARCAHDHEPCEHQLEGFTSRFAAHVQRHGHAEGDLVAGASPASWTLPPGENGDLFEFVVSLVSIRDTTNGLALLYQYYEWCL
jgi:hypothetical protein